MDFKNLLRKLYDYMLNNSRLVYSSSNNKYVHSIAIEKTLQKDNFISTKWFINYSIGPTRTQSGESKVLEWVVCLCDIDDNPFVHEFCSRITDMDFGVKFELMMSLWYGLLGVDVEQNIYLTDRLDITR